MEPEDLYARVITDVPLLSALDYRVPPDMLLAVGDIVIVPVGNRKKAGVVIELRPWTEIEKGRLKSVSLAFRRFLPSGFVSQNSLPFITAGPGEKSLFLRFPPFSENPPGFATRPPLRR